MSETPKTMSQNTFSLLKVMVIWNICYSTGQMTSTRGNSPCGELGSVPQGRGNGQKPWELASQNTSLSHYCDTDDSSHLEHNGFLLSFSPSL